ncbi:response regulator [Neptuniibacter sp. PT8_73]|uniref:response regulator n=1 Tax=Neptuniibacter sp. PT8_73 TaxID=3398206 RepID=UPI0039F5B105
MVEQVSVNEQAKILLVDDIGSMRALLVAILRELGYRDITQAASGEEACQLTQTHAYDVILCDWEMPGMGGLEVLNKVRESFDADELPFIMVTAEDETSMVKQAISQGVSDYIIKPFSAGSLREKIDRVTAVKADE